MATTAAEFKGMRPDQIESASKALDSLREKIARAMAKLGTLYEDPRWVESNVRLDPRFQSVTFLESVPDAEVEAAVENALNVIWSKFGSRFWNERAAAFNIPEFAYVDVFKRLGYLS